MGKTTMALAIGEDWPTGFVYLDLERPADIRRLADADAFLRSQDDKLVILDEVHQMPELMPILRGVIDERRRAGVRTGQFLLLGSASMDIKLHADESLAGRLSHCELGGVCVDEAQDAGIEIAQLWLRGGFPESLLASNDLIAGRWCDDLVRSYLERDVPMFAPRIPRETLRRLWTMVAYSSGSLLNVSRLASNLGVSGPTVDRYLDLLTDLALLRRLQPWFPNATTRVTKSPKVYVRDTGLLHSLLEINSTHTLLGHPSVGASFESMCVESLIQAADGYEPYFYRTSSGDEVDLILAAAGRPHIGIEIKLSSSAAVTSGFFRSCDALGIEQRYLAHGGPANLQPYVQNGVTVANITHVVRALREQSPRR
ncbi:MAG: ATP-binding protein [Propionibacteriaceae bacterium]|nr:ATP-binding protein [Propionibacteriaceae bacterium]